jgi:hypothetical protein
MGEKGEGNGKFIGVMIVFILAGYILYAVMPMYYKEQQLHHDIKEETRVGAVNGRELTLISKDCKKIVDDIDFPQPVKVVASRKGDKLTIACTGSMPINFIVYKYEYKIDFEESASRGQY